MGIDALPVLGRGTAEILFVRISQAACRRSRSRSRSVSAGDAIAMAFPRCEEDPEVRHRLNEFEPPIPQ